MIRRNKEYIMGMLGCEEWLYTLDKFVKLADDLVETTNLSYKDCFYKIADLLSSEHFGVEYCYLDNFDDIDTLDDVPEIFYLNMGDTYSTTLILTDDALDGVKLIVSSWGDWYESIERYYIEKYNVLRCPNCSHFTPFEYGKQELEGHVCEYCERPYE